MNKINYDFFSIKIDNLKIVALSCGDLIENGWLQGIDSENYERLILREGLVKEYGGIRTSNTSFLIDDGNHVFMIDAGSNYDNRPETLKINLEKAGYDPVQVSEILLTHLHDDHYLGLNERGGNAIFPNATLYYSKKSGHFHHRGYNVKTFNHGDILLGNVHTIDLPGHYHGHTGYMIKSHSGKEIFFWGDVVQNYAIQLPKPNVSSIFDTNPRLGNTTRRNLLEVVADGCILIGGSHMPFPSLGYVTKDGDAYGWRPVNNNLNASHYAE